MQFKLKPDRSTTMELKWRNSEGQSPFIFDRIKTWQGVRLSHWRVRRGQMLEVTFSAHHINIPLSGTLLASRQTATGRHETVLRKPGTLCLIPAGMPISARWDDEVECVSVGIDPALISRAASDFFVPGQIELVGNEQIDDPLMTQIGLTLLAEAESSEPAGQLYVDALVQTLALHLVRHYSTAENLRGPFNGGLSGHRLRRAKEFIDENLEQDLSLDEIADAVGLSPFHFSRSFKRTTGMTPQQFLWQTRIARARQLLTNSELPIVEISARAGFKTQSHFTTLFRKFTTMTPRAWREASLR
jgi:AraC family transcriptional regulator